MMETMSYKFPPEVQDYMDIVEKEAYKSCEEQKLLIEHIKKCFNDEKI